jgi:uncharacterized repeat protein (TIGR03837 family)
MQAALGWDIFCQVIDNLGDVGVCWRLAADLAERGHRVRLFIDDATPLAWMAPHSHTGVQVLPWPAAHTESLDVVIEAFGCNPPAAYVAAMAQRSGPPVWINLEYLSAEPYVERSHGLPSPQANGLTKWFFYPGFTPKTGGLLRTPTLMQHHAEFDRYAWLAQRGLAAHTGEQVVSLFCYGNRCIPSLLADLARQPTLLLLTPGHAQSQVAQLSTLPHTLRTAALPWLSQTEYDHLLWSCDLNFVRGEDSLVRALWAGAPFVWQAYVQDDQAHHRKVQAMLQQMAAPQAVAKLWQAWNGFGTSGWPGLPPLTAWRQSLHTWRQAVVQQQPDLVSALHSFAWSKRSKPP